MSKIYYLCPADNISKESFDIVTAQITPHLDRAGVSFSVTDTSSETTRFLIHAEEDPLTTARRIIQADGKEFVPVTPGEYIDEAIRMGLFPADIDWSTPITREEAAILAVRLLHLLRP